MRLMENARVLADGHHGRRPLRRKKIGGGERSYFCISRLLFLDFCMKGPWLLGHVEVEEKWIETYGRFCGLTKLWDTRAHERKL
jgi:hypothetical protein